MIDGIDRETLIRWLRNLDPSKDEHDPETQHNSRVNRCVFIQRSPDLSEADKAKAYRIAHYLEDNQEGVRQITATKLADLFIDRMIAKLERMGAN